MTKLDRLTGKILGTGAPETLAGAGGATVGDRFFVAGSRAIYAYSCAK